MQDAKNSIPRPENFILERDLEGLLTKIGLTDIKDVKWRYYYAGDRPRGVVVRGQYKDQEAMVKIYTRQEWAREPLDLQAFNQKNQSQLLKGPDLLAYQSYDSQKMWMATKFIDGQSWDNLPEIPFLTKAQKDQLSRVYLELLKNMPEPTRPKQWHESQGSAHFAEDRLWKWYNIGSETMLINPEKINDRFNKTLAVVRKEYDKMPLAWVHGHFCPSQLIEKNGIFYLSDWGHAGYYPILYEPAFTVWNLSFAAARQNVSWKKWLEETEVWKRIFREKVADQMKLSEEQFNHFFDLEMLERTCGNLLVHATETLRSSEERKQIFTLNSQLADYYLDNLK